MVEQPVRQSGLLMQLRGHAAECTPHKVCSLRARRESGFHGKACDCLHGDVGLVVQEPNSGLAGDSVQRKYI